MSLSWLDHGAGSMQRRIVVREYDVRDRVKRHNWGVGPEFTAKRRPVELIWAELCGSAKAARIREREIKGWSRAKKLDLIHRFRMQGKPSACPA